MYLASMQKIKKSKGFTIVEIVVAVGISGLLVAALSVLITRAVTGNRSVFENVLTAESTRKEVSRLSETLRNAQNTSGLNWLVLAEDNEITVQADIDDDKQIEHVRYAVEGTTLVRGITEAGQGESTRVIARGIQNLAAGQPLFTYISAEGVILASGARNSSDVERIILHVTNNTNPSQNQTGTDLIVELTPRTEDTPPARMWPVSINLPSDPDNVATNAAAEITTTDPISGDTSTYSVSIADLNNGSLETYSGGYYVNLNYQSSTVGSDLPGWYTWVGPILVDIGAGGQRFEVTDKFLQSDICTGSSAMDVFGNCVKREVGVCDECAVGDPSTVYQKYVPIILIRQPNGSIDYVQDIQYTLGQINTQYPPTIVITKPTQNQQFTNSQLITLDADAADVDGEVVQVDYYINGSLVRVDNNSADGWQNDLGAFPPGNYTLAAFATDNDGLVGVAQEEIHFTVTAGVTPTPTPPPGGDPWCTTSAPNTGSYPLAPSGRTTNDYINLTVHVYVADSTEPPDQVYFITDATGNYEPLDRTGATTWPFATLVQTNGPLSNGQYEYIYNYTSTQTKWPPQLYVGWSVTNFNDEPGNTNSVEYSCDSTAYTRVTSTPIGPSATPTPTTTVIPNPNPSGLDVTITSPANNSYTLYDNNLLSLTAQVQASVGTNPTHVEFYQDGINFATDSFGDNGWTASWTKPGPGYYEFTAKAYAEGIEATSNPTRITVYAPAPTGSPTPTPLPKCWLYSCIPSQGVFCPAIYGPAFETEGECQAYADGRSPGSYSCAYDDSLSGCPAMTASP